ncbi:hypothetical protein F5Y19DRAFT_484544 [Xylariaceae sp. FL1651]|nr:hypothetical protein F5Y19DRAFT_484544 [Xylariaceae sp. FL1651]
MFALLIWASCLLAVVSSHPLRRKAPCPPLGNGTITIASYQLYPENVDFDEHSCLLWYAPKPYANIGSLYNASVVVYDPYAASVVATLEFPHITRTKPFHIGGVAWDPYSSSRSKGGEAAADQITILVDAAPAHETAGRDVSGDNYVLRWDAVAQKVLWSVNLTATTRGRYGGPQDIEHDRRGNIYVLGTYPGTLLRVAGDGSAVDEWYIPPPSLSNGSNSGGGGAQINHAVVGYTGLAAADGDVLLVADAKNHSADGGALYRFDMSAAKGVPALVPVVPSSRAANASSAIVRPGDAIYLPPKYNNTVLLIAEHDAGVSVVRSVDGSARWRTAEFLGRIPNPPDVAASGALVTAAVEMAGRVFMVEEWFSDTLVPGTSAGNRTMFPLVDITAQLEALVSPQR